jgi:hypothetical protein
VKNNNNNNAKWRVVSEGCHHVYTQTQQERDNPIECRYNPETGIREDYFVCKGCASGERGFCHNTILHPILTATKINSLEEKLVVSSP